MTNVPDAVAGEADMTVPVVLVVPSNVKVTVPVGNVVNVVEVEGVMVAVDSSESPTVGAVVDGDTTIVVDVFAVVMVTAFEVAVAK
jgi:hypothetical protein